MSPPPSRNSGGVGATSAMGSHRLPNGLRPARGVGAVVRDESAPPAFDAERDAAGAGMAPVGQADLEGPPEVVLMHVERRDGERAAFAVEAGAQLVLQCRRAPVQRARTAFHIVLE